MTVLTLDEKQNELLASLLQVGNNLSSSPNWRSTLDMILHEARRLGKAEAGSLSLLENGRLTFIAVQNDQIGSSQVSRMLLDKNLPSDSIASFVARSGLTLNIPDSHNISEIAPYSVNREFEMRIGYDVRSILALPINESLTNGTHCVGVLELYNHLDDDGQISSFGDAESTGLHALASMAGLTIGNILLQQQLREAKMDAIFCLSAAAEFRDSDAIGHIQRVSQTAATIARATSLGEDQIDLIRNASALHDVGKIGIPDAVLRNRNNLSTPEVSIMQTHTAIGGKILANGNSEVMSQAREIAMSHHEKWDGSGYPNNLSGLNIPMAGRIVALADVLDALLSKRCYKEAFEIDLALSIVRQERGKHFDPDLTDTLFDNIESILDTYQ